MGCAQSKTEEVVTMNSPEAETAAAPIESSAAPAETEPVTEEPKVEETVTEEAAPAAEESAESETEAVIPEETTKELYKITGHEIDEDGVVFYTVEAVEGDVSFMKRFSEFKALMVKLGSPKNVPALPDSGLGVKLRGKHNPVVIKERETQLAVVLNAIANDAELAEKEAFKEFAE